MKRPLIALLALLCAACTPSNVKLLVKVANNSDIDRCCQTVEINLNSIKMADESLTEDRVTVLDSKKNEIVSQIYKDRFGNTTLLFQADVKAGKTAEFYLAEGQRNDFPTKCYSRYVPERMDDYAFENDLVAGRIYGPALADPKTPGADIWVKNTSKLIIDEWFAKDDYHNNHGEGMDCYKVGNTLGAGALAPLLLEEDGQHIMLVGNYSSWEHVTDGPIRTSALLTYGPFQIDGANFIIEREISLDAGTHFMKNKCKFVQQDGPVKISELPAVLGAIVHEVKASDSGANYISFTEKTSDTKDPDRDGDISVGLILSPAIEAAVAGELEGHKVLKCFIPVGRPVEYWTGNAWSRGLKSTVREGLCEGSFDKDAWAANVADFAACTSSPLRVSIEAK